MPGTTRAHNQTNTPPSLASEIEDCTQSWTYPPDHFDFIYMRWLVGSIDDWYRLFKQAFECLRPGGWFESYEMSTTWYSDDGSVTDKTALGQWGKIYVEGGRQSGRTFTVLDDELQRKAMEAAGFVDIQERNIKVRQPSTGGPALHVPARANSMAATYWALAPGPAVEGDRRVHPGHAGAGRRGLSAVHCQHARLDPGGDHGVPRHFQTRGPLGPVPSVLQTEDRVGSKAGIVVGT